MLTGASHLPSKWVEKLSTLSGWLDASSPSVFELVKAESISRWVVGQYPKRRYPAAMIGSTNGAATNLCAALGIPWLPQTLLTCVRHSADKDRPEQHLNWATPRLQGLLHNNPELRVYQMHDPNQDRLKVGRVAYFRLKRTQLGNAYKQFLKERLEPGATLFILDCQSTWLGTSVSDHHFFQVGGEGTLSSEAYIRPSEQIARFLHRRGSRHHHWNPPEPNGYWLESEWGFDPALAEDIEQFAAEHGFRVRRIVFDHAQALSDLVADLYRWWYRRRQISPQHLLVQSFIYLQPWRVLQQGLVPYWTVFNDQTSLQQLNTYLDGTHPYDDIDLSLFSNGLHSIGIASLEEWHSVLSRARRQGAFLGVDESTYPRDLASFTRYAIALARQGSQKKSGQNSRQNSGQLGLEPLSLLQLDDFLREQGVSAHSLQENRYAVSFKD